MIDFIFHYLHLGAHTWGGWVYQSHNSRRRECGACMRSQFERIPE
jgi:hypothetical protein